MVRGSPESAVSSFEDFMSGFAARNPNLLKRLSRIEDRWIGFDEDATRPDRPIYVTGMARSGTTILLEILAEHPSTASHLYKDYPFVLTPVLWNWFLDRATSEGAEPIERFHKDRIRITPESPEAMEEIVWMAFFPDSHDPFTTNVLDGNAHHPEFERFYTNHIRKIERLRQGQRYLAKGNYNLARLDYIAKLFPDALFVIPVRNPVSHVASLMKQHNLFTAAENQSSRILNRMRRAGHFEFGLDRRPLNFGDVTQVRRILSHWQEGREIRGWAANWAATYGHVASRLAADRDLAERTIIVRYEDLCDRPLETVEGVFAHCQLALDVDGLRKTAARLSRPRYYASADLIDDENEVWDEARDVAANFGYNQCIETSPGT